MSRRSWLAVCCAGRIAQADKAFAVSAGGEGEELDAAAGAEVGSNDPFGGALGGLGGLGGAMGGMPGGMPPGVTPEMYQKMMKVIYFASLVVLKATVVLVVVLI